MRIIDVLGGIPVIISEEENVVSSKIKEEGKIYRKSLNEREREVAKNLVTKGVLERYKDDTGSFYIFSDLEDIWRN